MKKRVTIWMCILPAFMPAFMLAFMLLGCGQSEDKNGNAADTGAENMNTEEAAAVNTASAVEILETVWSAFEEDERFPVGGGDYENPVTDAPGKFSISEEEALDSLLGMPKEGVKMIDDAASMVHMMNANTFTAGAYHLKDSRESKALADALKQNILNRQWMCGFPDTLLIASVGDEYIVSAFGKAQNMENFKTKLLKQYEEAEVIYEENLAE